RSTEATMDPFGQPRWELASQRFLRGCPNAARSPVPTSSKLLGSGMVTTVPRTVTSLPIEGGPVKKETTISGERVALGLGARFNSRLAVMLVTNCGVLMP